MRHPWPMGVISMGLFLYCTERAPIFSLRRLFQMSLREKTIKAKIPDCSEQPLKASFHYPCSIVTFFLCRLPNDTELSKMPAVSALNRHVFFLRSYIRLASIVMQEGPTEKPDQSCLSNFRLKRLAPDCAKTQELRNTRIQKLHKKRRRGPQHDKAGGKRRHRALITYLQHIVPARLCFFHGIYFFFYILYGKAHPRYSVDPVFNKRIIFPYRFF